MKISVLDFPNPGRSFRMLGSHPPGTRKPESRFNMGKVVSCDECRKAYRTLETLADLRDNDSICLVCNHLIEVEDWDRVLASYEDDDYDDVPEELDEDDFGDDYDDDLGDALDDVDADEMDGDPALAVGVDGDDLDELDDDDADEPDDEDST